MIGIHDLTGPATQTGRSGATGLVSDPTLNRYILQYRFKLAPKNRPQHSASPATCFRTGTRVQDRSWDQVPRRTDGLVSRTSPGQLEVTRAAILSESVPRTTAGREPGQSGRAFFGGVRFP